jgi:hypothetical protein
MCAVKETSLDLTVLTADRFARFLGIIMEQSKEPSVSPTTYVSPEFYSTLRYVAFPDLDAMRRSSSSSGIAALAGREVEIILEWLHSTKKVNKIIELRIYDSWEKPHSEDSIERSLICFDVEILDWRRADLSVRTIRAAAPNVRVLYLYGSGGWAVLSDWTSSRLESLHEVRFASYLIYLSRYLQGIVTRGPLNNHQSK